MSNALSRAASRPADHACPTVPRARRVRACHPGAAGAAPSGLLRLLRGRRVPLDILRALGL